MAAAGGAAEGRDTARIIFDACDVDGDNLVSRSDLEQTLRRLAAKSEGSRAIFASFDKDGDGALEYQEFVDAVFGSRRTGQPSAPATSSVAGGGGGGAGGGSAVPGLPSRGYFAERGLAPLFVSMARAVDEARPDDPHRWLMQYLSQQRPVRRPAAAGAEAGDESGEGDEAVAVGVAACSSGPRKNRKSGPKARVNTSAVLRKTPKKLLDAILSEPGWEAVEAASDTKCDIYFTWDSKAFLMRLGHPSATASVMPTEAVPRLPEAAWINRMPGMGHLCDKVNMALALRFMQQLWPSKFRFWPRSWLLPAETDALRSWLRKHGGGEKHGTVIVKPSDGSLGEGIFLAQSASDLDAKLLARPQWGAGFSALAQKYLPDPLLIGGLKFDLRLYVVVTSMDPPCAYLCREGLARFCTTKYEAPTSANANQHYMHLTNFSLNKKSAGFVKANDPFDPASQASKRPLTTLLRQIEAQEAAAGRIFDEEKFYKACEEVTAVLLQAIAPVLNVTYSRVAKECTPKPKAKVKPKRKARKADDSDSDEEGSEGSGSDAEAGGFEPQCFQVLGVDVLMDSKLQPWLLEMNGRPSMDIEEPVLLEEAPEGTRRCPCRDMDGEEHAHMISPVDLEVKRQALRGAFEIVLGRPVPEQYREVNFDEHGPGGDLSDTLQLIARLYQVAGGGDKAFTTYGLRRALANSIKAGLNPHDLDSAVTRWKHQGYRQSGDLERDTADVGVLDFAGLLQEVANLRKDEDEDPLDALSSLIEECDPDE